MNWSAGRYDFVIFISSSWAAVAGQCYKIVSSPYLDFLQCQTHLDLVNKSIKTWCPFIAEAPFFLRVKNFENG
jgi:hypothetical protein